MSLSIEGMRYSRNRHHEYYEDDRIALWRNHGEGAWHYGVKEKSTAVPAYAGNAERLQVALTRARALVGLPPVDLHAGGTA